MTEKIIEASTVAADNDARIKALREDYQALGARLARRGVDIDGIKVKSALMALQYRPGALVPAGHDLRVFPARVSPGISSTR